MGDSGSRVRRFAGRTTAFVKERPRSQQLIGGGLALALVTAPFGGWKDAVDYDAYTPVEVGESFDVGPFELTVRKAVSLPELAPAMTPDEGNKVLAIVLQVENVHNRPEYLTVLRDALHLDEDSEAVVEDDGRPLWTAVNYEDSGHLSTLNPGLRYQTVLLWQQDEDWAGDSVKVIFDRLTFVEDDGVGGLAAYFWTDEGRGGQSIEIPVEVKS